MPVKRADTGRFKHCDELFLIKQPVTTQGPALPKGGILSKGVF